MHFTLPTLIILGNFPLFLMENTAENHKDNNDTPSPEWIKYQQERHDPKYNKPVVLPKTTATNSGDHRIKNHDSNKQHRKVVKPNAQNKLDTLPRQNSFSKHQQPGHINDEEVYVEVEDYDDNPAENKRQHSAEEDANDANKSSMKAPSISGFIAFLKSLKKTWANKSLFRIDDKVEFLYNLKDTLMRAIEQQFSILWPDNDDDDDEKTKIANSKSQDRHLRSKRGILDASNIDFPPEAALMSINFLTFAVFLIKLVLQVVNIIKSKHVQLSSLGLNTNGFSIG